METADSTDKSVGLPVLFAVVAVLGAVGLTAFGYTGNQTASGWSFVVAMVAGSLSVASYHLHA
jgi:Trk-type K+ transport system membrane component